MSLPKFPARRSTIDIDGSFIEIRSLTRGEQAHLQQIVEAGRHWSDLEKEVIAYGTDTPLADVEEWYQATPGDICERISDAIRELSKLAEGAQKSSGTGDSPGG